MAYQITYGPVKRKKENPGQGRWKLSAAVFAVVLVLSSLTSVFREELLSILLPGDPAVTAAALQTMTEQIMEGEQIGVAFTCFCQEIIENAELSQ